MAGGSFYGGMKYQAKKLPVFSRQFGTGQFDRQGNFQRNGNTQENRPAGFRPVNGEITEKDDKSITVKAVDGSSKIVVLSDSTQINKADTAYKDDLKVGEKVAVFGTENPDGSVTAQNIQLNPIIRAMNGNPGQ